MKLKFYLPPLCEDRKAGTKTSSGNFGCRSFVVLLNEHPQTAKRCDNPHLQPQSRPDITHFHKRKKEAITIPKNTLNIQIYTIISYMRFSFKNLNVPELSFCWPKSPFCDTLPRELPGISQTPDICLRLPLYP